REQGNTPSLPNQAGFMQNAGYEFRRIPTNAKFRKEYRTGSLARIEVFGLLHAVLECKAGEGFFCRVAA
ncbi:MAG TPA: hypothetical protein VFT03_11135, partial [Rubrobacteraceae bacterium]|nr:hypothetical protein [Rubrobacteraceae bacterium]